MNFSVLIELDNVHNKGIERARIGLTTIAQHVQLHTSDVVEVLIGAASDAPWVGALLVDSGFSQGKLAEMTRVIEVGDRRYYEVKNLLAEHARGSVLIMTDSDVIPQPGWLSSLVNHWTYSGADLLAGRTIIGPLSSWYERAISSVWIYDPRPRGCTSPTDRFYANNFMVSREVFLRYKFPYLEGQYRGACVNLAKMLSRDGTTMVRVDGALVLHPAPPLFKDAFFSQVLSGRDRSLEWRETGSAEFVGLSLRFLFIGWLRAVRGAVRCRRDSGQRLREIPLSIFVAVVIWSLRAYGLLVGRIRPSLLNLHP